MRLCLGTPRPSLHPSSVTRGSEVATPSLAGGSRHLLAWRSGGTPGSRPPTRPWSHCRFPAADPPLEPLQVPGRRPALGALGAAQPRHDRPPLTHTSRAHGPQRTRHTPARCPRAISPTRASTAAGAHLTAPLSHGRNGSNGRRFTPSCSKASSRRPSAGPPRAPAPCAAAQGARASPSAPSQSPSSASRAASASARTSACGPPQPQDRPRRPRPRAPPPPPARSPAGGHGHAPAPAAAGSGAHRQCASVRGKRSSRLCRMMSRSNGHTVGRAVGGKVGERGRGGGRRLGNLVAGRARAAARA